jgi:hypothetical protein
MLGSEVRPKDVESRADVLSMLDRNLACFETGTVDVSGARRFVSQRGTNFLDQLSLRQVHCSQTYQPGRAGESWRPEAGK